MLIQNAHASTLHGGNQVTLAYIRRKYWIINGKRDVRNILQKCVKCIRYKAQTAEQMMGELPAPRVCPAPLFTHTGVDYAGPIQIRTTKGRGHKSYKGYIAVFVCLTTKAIHLKAVSDMTTETFLAALKRFTARRGHCKHMYSDNGTNFVGASKLLQPDIATVIQDRSFQDSLATQGTQWHFNPPAAPHFGGIWEAGVKSVKHHLRRVIGETTLTFEELSTLLYQIEASLNSRPLTPLSNHMNDTTVLTPGHFLIGRPLLSYNHPYIKDEHDLSSRWKLIRKMNKDFWQAWSTEYLSRLQQRYKWKVPQDNFKPGDVVIIKENIVDPNRWPLAQITDVHPSDDGNVRVVTLKKSGGSILKRAIHSLVPLPMTKEKQEEPTQAVNINCNHYCGNSGSRKKKISTIISLLILCTTIFSSVTATYNLKYPHSGLYIEHMEHAKIERGQFRIESKINKTKIDEDMETAAGAVRDFKYLCDNITAMGHSTHCETLLHHLEEENKQLK
ncbi:uncharacterized protein [Onthophagus taurus]|uniref:uncharacterized protein n=1 Tax=Onthophagus taurus TaxID=166361 RepID=UPI0039BDF1AF